MTWTLNYKALKPMSMRCGFSFWIPCQHTKPKWGRISLTIGRRPSGCAEFDNLEALFSSYSSINPLADSVLVWVNTSRAELRKC